MNQIQIIGITPTELINSIANAVLLKLNPQVQQDVITSKQVEKMLGISHVTLQKYRDEKKIPFKQHGRKIFYSKSEVLKAFNR